MKSRKEDLVSWSLLFTLAIFLLLSLIALKMQDSEASKLGQQKPPAAPPPPPQQQQEENVIEIRLSDKRFQPAEVSASDGDILRICNEDPFTHQPFNFDKRGNLPNPISDGEGVRLRPGQCLTHTISNPSNAPLRMRVFDKIHSQEKLVVNIGPNEMGISPDDELAEGVGQGHPQVEEAAALGPIEEGIEINLKGKQFVPERATIKHGETIRICNRDPIVHEIFNTEKKRNGPNPVGDDKQGVLLKTGQCFLMESNNPTPTALQLRVFDHRHSRERLILTILPAEEESKDPLAKCTGDVFTPMQRGFDLRGDGQSNAVLKQADPKQCQAMCQQDPQCMGYTYVRPGTYGVSYPVCWMKKSVGEFFPHENAVSGVRCP